MQVYVTLQDTLAFCLHCVKLCYCSLFHAMLRYVTLWLCGTSCDSTPSLLMDHMYIVQTEGPADVSYLLSSLNAIGRIPQCTALPKKRLGWKSNRLNNIWFSRGFVDSSMRWASSSSSCVRAAVWYTLFSVSCRWNTVCVRSPPTHTQVRCFFKTVFTDSFMLSILVGDFHVYQSHFH